MLALPPGHGHFGVRAFEVSRGLILVTDWDDGVDS